MGKKTMDFVLLRHAENAERLMRDKKSGYPIKEFSCYLLSSILFGRKSDYAFEEFSKE